MSVKNKNFMTASVIYTLIFAVFMVLIWNLPSDRLYVGIALVLFPLFLTASIIVGIKFKNISGHILFGLTIGSVLTMLALVFWGLSRYTFVYNSFFRLSGQCS